MRVFGRDVYTCSLKPVNFYEMTGTPFNSLEGILTASTTTNNSAGICSSNVNVNVNYEILAPTFLFWLNKIYQMSTAYTVPHSWPAETIETTMCMNCPVHVYCSAFSSIRCGHF